MEYECSDDDDEHDMVGFAVVGVLVSNARNGTGITATNLCVISGKATRLSVHDILLIRSFTDRNTDGK